MTPSAVLTASIPGVVAHAVHYSLVFGGLALVLFLLVSSRPGLARLAPSTAHEVRVAQLRAQASAGRLEEPAADLAAVGATVCAAEVPAAFPIAVVSSVAAAGVHAAAMPGHAREGLAVGAFFVVSALAQLGWALLAVGRRPGPVLLRTAVVGNASIVALWLATRTLGLPFGLSEVEPVGSWDLAATTWELTTVVACVALLRSPMAAPRRTALDVAQWSRGSLAWLVGSVLVLAALGLTGAPA